MCGIIGYVGTGNTADILMRSLKLLEYRGYDSSGVAFCSGKSMEVFKCPDRVSVLEDLVKGHGENAKSGIGHTRWATHGSVSFKNSHPHQAGKVTLVHNGIIENYKELIQTYHIENRLLSTGDSEVAAVLLDEHYKGDPYAAISETVELLQGTYALVMMFSDRPDEIYAIRKVSPIVVSEQENGKLLASDLNALSTVCREYFVLPEKTILKMSLSELSLKDLSGKDIKPEYEQMDFGFEDLDKKGHPFYMEKEIAEEGTALRRCLASYAADGLPSFEDEGLDHGFFCRHKHIVICACGTSYHAGLLSKRIFEKYAGISTEVYLSSEFIYERPLMEEDSVLVVISQSGETIDTLEALRCGRKEGKESLAIVNVKGSSIAREADHVLYMEAGPEIAVASTKAYTCQLAILYLLAFAFAKETKQDGEDIAKLIEEMRKAPDLIEAVYEERETYRDLAKRLKDQKSVFMIGRSLDYYILMEAALKMKEISYIHCEAYASGELKHGPIALIEKDTPVIACLSQKDLLAKESSNIKEVRARGAKVFCFIKESIRKDFVQKVEVFALKDLPDDLMVFSAIPVFQLLAYYLAIEKGVSVDKPRNLAKVVTVE